MLSLTAVRDLLLPASRSRQTKDVVLDIHLDFPERRLALKAFNFHTKKTAERYINPNAPIRVIIDNFKSEIDGVIEEVSKK